MKPNAALLFIIAGLTVILLQFPHPVAKYISRVFSYFIFITGFLTLLEFSFRLNFGLDEIIYKVSDATGYTPYPSRMALNAALSFVLMSVTFLFLSFWSSRSNLFVESCLLIIVSISSVGLLGYAIRLNDAVGVTIYSRMAVNAAFLFLLLFLGIFSTFRKRFNGKITIEQKILSGFVITINIFLFILFLLLANTNLMYKAADSVRQTEKVKERIRKIDKDLSKVSNAEHGYIFTGNKVYLDKMTNPIKEILDNVKTLRDLTAKNPVQIMSLDFLEPLIHERVEHSGKLYESRYTGEIKEKGYDSLSTNRNEFINDSISVITTRMIREQDRLLSLLNTSENYRSKQVMTAVKIGSLFQVFLIILIFFLLRKDLKRRKESELMLNRMNMDLEDRILDRTKALQKSEKKYRAIFENIQDVFFQTDLEGTVLEISPSIKDISEFDRSELIGKKVNHLYFNLEDRKSMVDAILIIGEVLDYEVRIKTRSNQLKYVSINARLIFNTNNKPDHIDGIARDITQRKQSESQMELLRWAIEQSPVTILVTDKDGAIEYINPKFTEVTGYSLDEVKGKNPRILNSGYHAREFYDELWDTILSGKEWLGEFYNKKKNGELYWERAIISNIVNLQGEISSFISIREDITERKKIMEDFLKAKEKAEESNKLKEAFLNNISHEIRTPFTGILGFLSALQDEGLTADERAEYFGIINKSAYKFMNTINDIAEMSQIHAGQLELTISAVNLKKLTEELSERFKNEVESKGLQFIVNNKIADDIKLISTDSKKLNAILNILMDNAIKFTYTGSIELTIGKNNNFLEFSLKDTGIGIPGNKLQVILEPFRQADSSTTRQFEGLGLGLTIAKAYIQTLGGKLLIESEESKGSTFHFILPLID